MAFKQYCQTVIAAQRRGELGILPATSYIEDALGYPELKEHPATERVLDKACALMSPLRPAFRDQQTDWRELVDQVTALPE